METNFQEFDVLETSFQGFNVLETSFQGSNVPETSFQGFNMLETSFQEFYVLETIFWWPDFLVTRNASILDWWIFLVPRNTFLDTRNRFLATRKYVWSPELLSGGRECTSGQPWRASRECTWPEMHTWLAEVNFW